MAGLLDTAKGGPEKEQLPMGDTADQATPPADGQDQSNGQEINYDDQIAEMESRVPPDMKEDWDRIMVAGMKFMFDEQGNSMINKALETEGNPAKTVGEGCANLMLLLFKESGSKMKHELIIPGGIALMMLLVKYINKAGFPRFTAAQFGQALEIYMYKVLSAFGIQQQQFDGYIDQMAAKYKE